MFEYVSRVGGELIRAFKSFSYSKYNNEFKSIPQTSDFETINNFPLGKYVKFEKKDLEFYNKLVMTTEKIYQDFKLRKQADFKLGLYPFLDELKRLQNRSGSSIFNVYGAETNVTIFILILV